MIPNDVDQLTAPWFAAVLERDVEDAKVIDRSSGTTGRALVALRGEAGLPATVFVKLPPFDPAQREFVAGTGMGPAEARFYRDLAREVAGAGVRVPRAWYSTTDDHDYVMVLEDLTASGCRFPSANDADIEARARDITEQLALLHASYWESPRFEPDGDLEWLTARGRRGGDGRYFVQKAVEEIGGQMDEAFHRVAAVYLGRTAAVVELLREGAGTLVHGDSHLGNLFVDVRNGGRTGFLDWAVVCRGPGIRDLAYVLCNSVPSEIRARIERELVERYCAMLGAAGVTIDAGATWDRYRIHAIYSWVAAVSTAGMGSKWQPIEIGMAASRRATVACAHLDTAGLIESILA